MSGVPTPEPRPHRLHPTLVGSLVVFALSLLCYWPALGGEILWDDPAHVTRPELRSFDGLVRIWTDVHATQQFYPVLHSAFWIESQLWGDAVVGYHLINVVWHALACVLFAALLGRLWRRRETPTGAAPPAAWVPWLAASVAAVHPVCVESVAWISEQKNTLSLVFYLLATLAWLRFDTGRRKTDYAWATGWFVLALGSKTVTATLPAALLVIQWWRHGRIDGRRDVVPLLPWFGLAVIAGLSTAWIEVNLIGADGDSFSLPLWQRALLAGRILWFYLGSLAWPVNLAFFYELWDVPTQSGGWWPYLVAALGVTFALWWIRGRTRGPLAAWLLFGGSMFPALGFFNVFPFTFSYVADHFQYLASFSLIGAVTGTLAMAAQRLPRPAQIGTAALAAVLLLISIGITRSQARLYDSNEALFAANVARVPDNWMAQRCLAWALTDQPGQEAASEAHYRESLRLNPRSPDTHLALAVLLSGDPAHADEVMTLYERALELRPHYAEAHFGIAERIERDPARLAEAIGHYEAALRTKPNLAGAHVGLAKALVRAGDDEEAFAHFNLALDFDPNLAAAHDGLGLLLSGMPGRQAEAEAEFQAALRLDPEAATVHYNLANLLAPQPGRQVDAVTHYETALRLDPDLTAVHFNLANTLATLPGRMADAIAHYESALAQEPDSAEIHVNLANALMQLPGRQADGLAHYQTALDLDPTLPSLHQNLGLLFASLPGRGEDALRHGREAVRLAPRNPATHHTLAIIHAQLNQLADARREWEQALALDPNFTVARENLRRLDQLENR